MTSPRHLAYFIALGLFWGLSPTFYKTWGVIGVPISHVIFLTGLGVGVALAGLAKIRLGVFAPSRAVWLYGLGCAALMNMPFAFGIFLANHVPPTELALVISTSPLVNYMVALATGREIATPHRLLAILLGIISSAMLIITREGSLAGSYSNWLLAAFSLPFFYSAYNFFAARRAPPAADTLTIGAAESFWSGLLALPFLLWFAPPWLPGLPQLASYWTVAIAGFMWVVERIAYFTLIREKGAVYTAQAVYLATPAAVIFASIFFGGARDIWLWASLAVLMLALWFNNSGPAAKQQTA